MRTDIIKRYDEIVNWVKQHKTKSFMYNELKCQPETLEYHLKKQNLNYSGNQGRKGEPSSLKITADELIKRGRVGGYITSHRLRIKLIEDGIKKDECEICKISKFWNNNPISLQLHHVDGNHKNNEIKNLQILCPNCHSQTENFSGKGKRKKIK